jgi:hypothetical protein
MLLDTIQRLQVKTINLVSVDSLRANGKKVPPQIHSVPAFMLMPSKQILFGKQVFDHLLLPGKGILVSGVIKQQQIGKETQQVSGEPQAFTMNISSLSGDNYSFIEDSSTSSHRNYAWSSINDMDASSSSPSQASNTNTTLQSNTRVKKEILDFEEFKAKRAEDLNVVINTEVNLPPVNTY